MKRFEKHILVVILQIFMFLTIINCFGVITMFLANVYNDNGEKIVSEARKIGEGYYRNDIEEYFRKIIINGNSAKEIGMLEMYGEDSNYVYELYEYDMYGARVLASNFDGGEININDMKSYPIWTSKEGEYSYIGGMRQELRQKDAVYHLVNTVEWIVQAKYWLLISAVMLIIIDVSLFMYANFILEKKLKESGEYKKSYLSVVDKIPLDLYTVSNIWILFLGINAVECLYGKDYIVGMIIYIVIFTSMVVSFIVSVMKRVKMDTVVTNNILYRICKNGKRGLLIIKKVILMWPLYWKALLVWILISGVEILFLLGEYERFIVFWIVEKILSTVLFLVVVINLRKLQKVGEGLSQGNMTVKADTGHMLPSFKKHGENLNGVSIVLQKAIEESVKSERMKAELITNVSHDIKTPLTSIINYVDLLKKEGVNGENSQEYIDVIDRQSAKLKKLTEDLIEASKASTGNIKLNKTNIDVNVLLGQALGEYVKKLEESNLTLVSNLDQEPLTIIADGNIMWRVFDNVLSNICKYSKNDTRVYLSAVRAGDMVSITFKNISKEALNISSSELMERFVRGDESRNTEGSGLGLSIAKNFVELQGGTFEIEIDGDLFKVIINMPSE